MFTNTKHRKKKEKGIQLKKDSILDESGEGCTYSIS